MRAFNHTMFINQMSKLVYNFVPYWKQQQYKHEHRKIWICSFQINEIYGKDSLKFKKINHFTIILMELLWVLIK